MMENPHLKWMITRGTPMNWKPPYFDLRVLKKIGTSAFCHEGRSIGPFDFEDHICVPLQVCQKHLGSSWDSSPTKEPSLHDPDCKLGETLKGAFLKKVNLSQALIFWRVSTRHRDDQSQLRRCQASSTGLCHEGRLRKCRAFTLDARSA